MAVIDLLKLRCKLSQKSSHGDAFVNENDRPTYVITLRPEPHVEDPVRELRHILKLLLRRFGFRAISVTDASKSHHPS